MHPLIDLLEDLGARTERGLERCKLPLGVRESPELLVSARAEHAFVTEMARREGIEDFGRRAASAQHRHLTTSF
jgi:hypothetical protein